MKSIIIIEQRRLWRFLSFKKPTRIDLNFHYLSPRNAVLRPALPTRICAGCSPVVVVAVFLPPPSGPAYFRLIVVGATSIPVWGQIESD